VEFNKVKSILLHARAFTLLGRDRGISLQLPDAVHLRSLIVGQVLRHLADPGDEEPDVLAEAFFGPDATSEQRILVASVLQAPPPQPEEPAGLPEDGGPLPSAPVVSPFAEPFDAPVPAPRDPATA
jgi:hypothetical protein